MEYKKVDTFIIDQSNIELNTMTQIIVKENDKECGKFIRVIILDHNMV